MLDTTDLEGPVAEHGEADQIILLHVEVDEIGENVFVGHEFFEKTFLEKDNLLVINYCFPEKH